MEHSCGFKYYDDKKMTVATWENKLANLICSYIGHLK
jgi:hypothetical protein